MVIGSYMPRRSVWDPYFESLEKEFPEHRFLPGLKPGEEEPADLAAMELMLAGRLPENAYLAPGKLKAIFQAFTGINHLPCAALASRGVRVFNVHSNAFDVAEKALAMTLAFYGRIIEYHNDLHNRVWHGFWVRGGAEDNWNSLSGRKCLILGTGAIGIELAKLLKAFSCTVYGWRRRQGLPAPESFDEVVPDLAAAVAKAEIVFVTLPATGLTEGLLSRELLSTMKGKLLVNVGRGSIVDEEGLYLALKGGVLAGAAIDTWYQYPPEGKVGAPSRFPIHELPNVVLSPHVGGSTNQAGERSVLQTVENLRCYLRTGDCAPEADLRQMY